MNHLLLADIVLPTGDWINAAFSIVVTVMPVALTAIVYWAAQKYLGIKLDAHYSTYCEDVARDALQAAQTRLATAVPGQVVIPTQNALLNEAANFILETELPAFIKWLGGKEGIEKWLQSKIAIVPQSSPAAA